MGKQQKMELANKKQKKMTKQPNILHKRRWENEPAIANTLTRREPIAFKVTHQFIYACKVRWREFIEWVKAKNVVLNSTDSFDILNTG